jgi:hypothetical protein
MVKIKKEQPMDKKRIIINRLLKKLREENVYEKASNIPSLGKGLFANKDIPRDKLFVEFQGKLYKPNEKNREFNPRSTVMFSDGYSLSCYKDDLASFANDCIQFPPTTRRKLVESLKLEEPFYKRHPNSQKNCDIYLDEINHRAYLKASMEIKKDEECWTHYAFDYWFKHEAATVGFAEEEEIEKNGFPKKFFEFPAFKLYISEFYPDSTGYKITKGLKTKYCVKITFPDHINVYCDMPDYNKIFTTINMDEVPEIIEKQKLLLNK